MKRSILNLGLLAMTFGCAPTAPEGAPGPAPELVGRIPGPPQSCVPIQSTASLHIDGGRIIYGVNGTMYLNRSECRAGSDDIPVMHPLTSQYCQGDIVQMVDRLNQIPGPSCVLGDWVPYRRPPR